MWKKGRPGISAIVRALVVVVLATLAPALSPGTAAADDGLIELDRAAIGRYMSPPSTITTWGGVTLVAWANRGATDLIRLRRAVGATGSFTAIPISMGGITQINRMTLLDDPKAKRTLLIANAQGRDQATTLGTYVWVSNSQGAAWSAPKKVWDYFGTADAALDGSGGLYLLTDLVGARVTHVPASLALQQVHRHDWVDLKGRLSSRGYTDMVSAGSTRTMLLTFQDSTGGMWVHRGLVAGTGAEVKVFDHRVGPTPVAGGTLNAAVGAVRNVPGNKTYRAYVRGINPTTGALGAVKQISSTTEGVSPNGFDLVHLVLPNSGTTGRFLAVWQTYSGELRYAKSMTTNPAGTWSTPITVKKATHGSYSYFANPSANQWWMVSTGLRTINGKYYSVVIATRIATDH